MADVIAPDDLVKMTSKYIDKFLDGQIWYLTKDIDYQHSPDLLIKRIRYRARQFNLKIHVRGTAHDGFRLFAYTDFNQTHDK